MERKTKETNRKEERKQKGIVTKRATKLTEYGRQLLEKQKLRDMYGMRERQFKRFFEIARRSQEATGETLLSLLERRLDNVVYRLKLSTTRPQARQVIVHGHILVNGRKVSAPSYLVKVNDEIAWCDASVKKEAFIKEVAEKRGAAGAKVPDWLEQDKKGHRGKVLRFPVRDDSQLQVNENSIVELYSK